MTSDRVARHHRVAHAKWETYATAPETKKISYGDEWIYAPDAVMMCPLFNDGADSPMADLASQEVLAAMQDFAPDGDMLTCEFRMWWKHMPDFRIITPFDCRAADWGFAVRDTYAGTLADGTMLELHEWDYVWTNEQGHITRWDWFVDSREWYQFLDLIGLDGNSLTYEGYTLNFLREGSIAG
ncbi:hypothetical protein [Mycobacterium vicinigordonae]|uniref:Nuclear transport factor 2 family protein n=1 Tax=Mycobacterium vicinigordonae TaxID=1719132 RepID=A0A7D6E0E0_9MYCO|nr:hypothetical protein [Mycobacterium vicinigordonae]QLL08868.1 hypothetical protein H0P51_08200 [Mycobacterium vicinigordonae]